MIEENELGIVSDEIGICFRVKKLSGAGHIRALISIDFAEGIYVKIIHNKQRGTYGEDKIHLWKLIREIDDRKGADGCFGSKDLRQAIPGCNNNTPAFVMAILKGIGLVEECPSTGGRRYCLRK